MKLAFVAALVAIFSQTNAVELETQVEAESGFFGFGLAKGRGLGRHSGHGRRPLSHGGYSRGYRGFGSHRGSHRGRHGSHGRHGRRGLY